MVVFTCNNCGDSVHKPKVEKHYQMACRSRKSLTCVDCLKDFLDNEYVSHTKCITEDERYAAKGTFKAVAQKGEQKQENWLDMIKAITEKERNNMSHDLSNLLNTISGYANVPRKKVKFMNFISNSVGRRINNKIIEDAWNLIEKYKNEHLSAKNAKELKENGKVTKENGKETKENGKEINENEGQTIGQHENGEEVTEIAAKKSTKKKRKSETEVPEAKKAKNESNNIEEQQQTEDFSFEEKILGVLNKKQQISLVKLQKKVLNSYIKHKGLTEHTEKHLKKFNKRLKRMTQVQINEDTVTLTN